MLFRPPTSDPTAKSPSRWARSAFTVRCWLCALLSAWLAAALVTANLSGAEPAAAEKALAPHTADQLEFFEKKIRPVLAQHCYSCHSEESRQVQANLWLDTRDGIRRGGDSGPSVVPGKPAESQLLDALRFESFEMPPSGKLPEAVIADFEKWIAMGAPDPREGKAAVTQTIDLEQGRKFWAFRPLHFTVPSSSDDDWSHSNIDRFLLAAMRQQGLEPVADADRRTLIRRAYFDLLGLPPSPQQVERFVADNDPEAFAKLVDRLLASPAFGERWGRHWLDVVRFAESSGGGRPLLFPNSWRYRDYIIRAFNTDKPFDRFVQEHLAGDLITGTPAEQADGLTAAGFLALGPHNYETQDKELLRMDIVDEQIDTMGKAMLGLTIGCARCHDHKFDPIPTRDYYALAGIFRSTKSLTPGNVSGWVEQMLPLKPQHAQAIEAFELAKAPLEQQIKKVQSQLKRLDAQLPPSTESIALEGIVIDNVEAELVGTWQESSSNRSFIGAGYLHDQNLAKGAKRVVYRTELPAGGQYEVRLTYSAGSNRAVNVPVTIEHAGGETGVNIDQKKTPPIRGVSISLGKFEFAAGQQAVVTIGTEGTSGVVVADAVQFLPPAEIAPPEKKAPVKPAEQARQAELRKQREAANAQLTQLQRDLATLQKNAPDIPKVMCVQDEVETGDYQICIRGNVHNLGADVPRGFLQVLSKEPPTIPAGQSGRLELAAWLTSTENPLPARVMVNRIWQHLFAHGLVRTVDNFGVMGDRPSHEQLLDYLAARFRTVGWSTKQLIREIMLTRAYQLASPPSPAAAELDPENRLLSHQNRRRLQGEVLRDSLLMLAGQLEPKAGGPSMRPGTKAELGYEFREHWRSVYLPVFRDTPMDVLEVFDFADPNVVQGQRNVSTRSTQALLMMNSPFVIDRAQASAAQLLADPQLSLSDRIDYVYQSALGRPPHSAERELSREFLQPAEQNSVEADERLAQWTRFHQAVWSSIDFRYVD